MQYMLKAMDALPKLNELNEHANTCVSHMNSACIACWYICVFVVICVLSHTLILWNILIAIVVQ